jgi:multidrug efflux pump
LFVRFFIDRPIFAMVISAVVALAGLLSVGTLPLAQYPPVTPPTIQVDCNYPGANAKTVAEAIAAPIEQQVNGVEDMIYMSSQCTSDGTYTLTVTFQIGTNLNLAQVLVQNRVNLALPSLPEVVRATGVTMRKRSPEILLTVSLNSPDGTYDQLYLSNYAVLRLKDELSRLPGISDVTIFGQRDFSMRIWLDPERLAARSLSPTDVTAALREQNLQVAGGQLGQPPYGGPQPMQLVIDTLGRLTTVEEFEQVVLKTSRTGAVVRLRDVARVELGAKSHDVANRFDNKPTIGLAIFLLSDANALATSDVVKEAMARLSQDFPEGMRYEIGYDTTPFIRESIGEVFNSLRESVLLVSIVVLIFLRSWRAAIIPLAAVPVAIIGTFAAMAALGFSINNLTLFGLVLSVGIVVDDAIVVVEAVQHHLEKGLSPRDATIQAMDEVTGPVVAVGVVLAAVFIPCAFLSGIVGQFFRQFAVTIAVSTLISTMGSLTLSPALCAMLLRPRKEEERKRNRLCDYTIGGFFRLFDAAFAGLQRGYLGVVRRAVRLPFVMLFLYGGLLALGAWEFRILPTGFIPQMDKGYLIASVQLPDAAAAERTREAVAHVAKIALETPGVAHVNAVAGNSFVLSAYGSNFGSMFIILKPFSERRSPDMHADVIINKLRARITAMVPEAQVNLFGAPAVSGLGRAGGFRFVVEDRGDVGFDVLQGQAENLIEKANQQRETTGLFTVFKANSPLVYLDVDRTACLTHGLDLREVYGALGATMGSRYVNDFNRFGRTWQVNVQADERFRSDLQHVRKIQVRNRRGEMIPLGAVLQEKEIGGPLIITRYNMYPAATINGNITRGVSTGRAIAVMEALADQELPKDRMAFEWTELTFIEKQSRNTGFMVFGLSVAFAFLVLAALYESWSLPLTVILVVPVCVVASLAGVWTAGHDVNIFTQVGFVVLIGLACKNAILIVEFAKYKRDEGADRYTAVLEACKLRFRPIVMTSIAFILGVLPLLYASGAGAEMRRTLGTAVFAGMIGVTAFGVFLTPSFFVLIDRLAGWRPLRHPWFQRLMGGPKSGPKSPLSGRAVRWVRGVLQSRNNKSPGEGD